MDDSDLAELNLQLANRAHSLLEERRIQLFKASMESGILALRTTALITGGSVVVGLAFVGSMYSSNQTEIAVKLFSSVFIFAIGALAAGLASGLSYLGQNKYNESVILAEKIYEPPFVTVPENYESMQRTADRWILAATASVGISYMCIFVGLILAWYAIR